MGVNGLGDIYLDYCNTLLLGAQLSLCKKVAWDQKPPVLAVFLCRELFVGNFTKRGASISYFCNHIKIRIIFKLTKVEN